MLTPYNFANVINHLPVGNKLQFSAEQVCSEVLPFFAGKATAEESKKAKPSWVFGPSACQMLSPQAH